MSSGFSSRRVGEGLSGAEKQDLRKAFLLYRINALKQGGGTKLSVGDFFSGSLSGRSEEDVRRLSGDFWGRLEGMVGESGQPEVEGDARPPADDAVEGGARAGEDGVSGENKPVIYAVVSGKGGVGKTTAAINLATSLHLFGQDVTLVDADVENANVSLSLNLPDFPIALQDVMNDGVDILHTVRLHYRGLKVVPSSVGTQKRTDLTGIGDALRRLSSTVIVDCAPGVNEGTLNVIRAADKVVVVSTPDVASLTDAVKAIRAAKKSGASVAGLVVNRVRNDRFELSSDEIEVMCEAPILARVPEDDEVRRSGFDCVPVVEYSPYARSSVEFNFLAAKLFDRFYEPPSFLFLRRLMRM